MNIPPEAVDQTSAEPRVAATARLDGPSGREIRNARTMTRLAVAIAPIMVMLAGAMVQARAPRHTGDSRKPALQEATAVPRIDPSQVVVYGAGATLDVGFDYDAASQVIVVRYRLRNTGEMPLAVFDRGNRQAVLAKRQQSGAVASPRFDEAGGDTTLSHVAEALPQPAPTVAPVPLAIRVAPDSEATGEFRFALASETPRRVRWCLGIATFDARDFSAPERAGGVEVWRASFAVVDRQQVLCTPWFDLASGAFVVAQ